MSEPESFGQQVKTLRHALGLTQDELARRVGCAPVTLRKIEYDDLRPSVQIAERLALSLNIPLESRDDFVRLARLEHPGISEKPYTTTPRPEEIGLENLSGRAVRGYALGELIGKGGMGVVYRAVQTQVGREVAVKIIQPQYANHPDFIRRFEAEAQIVAHLEHPHIVPLYDYWREPNLALLVMRLLRGGSLAKLLESGPPPLEMSLQIMEQVGSALIAAHRQGVVHRDLKPGNILLDEDHNAYLADFGIARQLADGNGDGNAMDEASYGSPAYISPEQIRSEIIRPQSDIYALGIVLYELLTGHTPYTGPTSIEVMHQHLSVPLPPLAARRPGLPGALDTILQRATCKEPLERYPDVASMLAELRTVLGGRDKTLEIALPVKELPPLTAADNPYKGLRAFGEGDAPDFFGRETLVQQLLVRMGEGGELSRLLAVVGPSGSGKSSVVKAGLIPALRRGGLPGSENWYIVDIHPGVQPFEAIAAGLLRIATNPPGSLLNDLQSDRRGLLRAVNRCLPKDKAVELVLVIDQFEEVFTLVNDEAQRALLLDSLLCAVLDERSRLRVVLTLRADFTDRPLQYMDFGELLRQRMELILPLTPDELEQAILGPAQRVGLQVAPELVSAISRDVAEQPGALPLMQYALTELFDQRTDRTLTRTAYRQVGGVVGALGRRAEQTYLELDSDGQVAARQLFLRLVTLGEGVEDTRRRVLRTELLSLTPPQSTADPSPEGRGVMDAVIESFGRARLLSFDRDPGTRTPTVEVAHEALLRNWVRLRGWLDENRDDLRLQHRLSAAVSEWLGSGRETSFLASGTRLEQYRRLANKGSLALTPEEAAYIQASEQERQRQQEREIRSQRILRIFRTFIAVAAIVAAIFAVVAFKQRQEALLQAEIASQERQEALRQASIGLAAQALAELEGTQSERAVLLALEALEYYPYTPQAESALARAVQETLPYREIKGETGFRGIWTLAWSPDGDYIAASSGGSGSGNHSVRILDASTGKTLAELPYILDYVAGSSCYTWGLDWSPDGERLAVAVNEQLGMYDIQCHQLEIYDPQNGQLLLALDSKAEYALDWSPDGSRLLTGGEDGVTRLWDANNGTLLRELPGQSMEVVAARYSPEGSRFATGSVDSTVLVRDASSYEILFTFNEPQTTTFRANYPPMIGVSSLAWSPDGSLLASALNDGIVQVWDLTTGLRSLNLIGHAAGIIGVEWSPDGRFLATLAADNSLRLWEASTGRQILTLTGKWQTVKFSPDGHYLSGSTFDIRIWDLSTLPPTMPFPPDKQKWGDVTWSPDGRFLATHAAVHDVMNEYLGWNTGLEGIVGWSPDSSLIVGSIFLPDKNFAAIVDAKKGEVLVELETPPPEGGLYFHSSWSPDGTLVSSSAYPGYYNVIWDPLTGKELARTPVFPCYLTRPTFSPDSRFLATGCTVGSERGHAKIFDAQTGELIRELTLDADWNNAAIWSPDSQYLAVTYDDGTVRIWDTATWEIVQTFASHLGEVWDVNWSPNGKRLVSGDVNGLGFVWDFVTGQVVQSFSNPWIWSVDWSPDGNFIAADNGITLTIRRAWQSTEELVAYAKACCVWRELTPEERIQYGLPER